MFEFVDTRKKNKEKKFFSKTDTKNRVKNRMYFKN